MNEFAPGVAIVTGGGSGIGRASALALAERGTAVGLVDIHKDAAMETADLVEAAGGRAAAVAADVSEAEQIDEAVTTLFHELGAPRVLVNAAGILDGYRNVDETDPSLWSRILAINLTGAFLFARRLLPDLIAAGGGRIVNIASAAGLVGDGGGAAYVTSKHGLVGLTRQMAVSYAQHGITVNAVCPGPIGTNLRANSMDVIGANAPDMANVGIGANPEAFRAIVPLGRRGTVEEVAACVRFLASEEAGYVTGHTLVVDGGWTAR